MELNFDKEMDALLRQAARSGEVVSTGTEAHLDADEIAAFAENALPEKTRRVYIKHFADCDRCRTILSNTILLNAEAETESASSAVTAAPVAAEIFETKTPWYRKLFLMPNLAYTMSALVLIVGGMLGFLVLQNLNKTGSSDVAQANTSQTAARGPNAQEDQIYSEPNESNTAAVSNMANTMATPPAGESNSMIAANTNPSISMANSASNSSINEPAKSEPMDERRDAKNEAVTVNKENGFQTDGASGAENRALSKTAEEKSADVKTDAVRQEDKQKVATATPAKPAAQPPPPVSKDDDAEDSVKLSRARKSAKREEFSKQIGGKTFNKVNGVWIDSAYNNYNSQMGNMALPRAKTIKRGSSDYRKLDKQVRIIAESLDAPVIIMWKDGAYRIQ